MTCQHEWRWLTHKDREERFFKLKDRGLIIDPEQPDPFTVFAPTNTICDKCGETIWAHGYSPDNPKGWRFPDEQS